MPLHDDKRPAQLETSEQPPSAIGQYYESKIQPDLDALSALLKMKKIKKTQEELTTIKRKLDEIKQYLTKNQKTQRKLFHVQKRLKN